MGEPEALYARPRTLFGATFLGAGTVLVGRARDGAAQLGALALPIPPMVKHEEDARVRVLVRPEQVTLSAEPPERGVRLLGRGTIVERSFLGALRRLRVRMPPIPGTRQAAPAVYGEESLLVDAVLPAGRDPGGPDVWVSLEGWHILAPPLPRVLACDLPDLGLPAPFELLRGLEGSLDATIALLSLTDDADQVDALRTVLPSARPRRASRKPNLWCGGGMRRRRSPLSWRRPSTTS